MGLGLRAAAVAISRRVAHAHDIPKSVTCWRSCSRAATGCASSSACRSRRCATSTSRCAAPAISRSAGSTRCSATRRACGSPNAVQLYEGDTRLTRDSILADARVAPVRPFVRDVRARRRAFRRADAAGVIRPRLAAGDVRRDDRVSDHVGPLALLDRPRARAPRRAHQHRAPLHSRRAASERAFQYIGDPGLVRLDPQWYQAALPIRRARLRAHPRRHRPPAVRLLPRHSVPTDSAADRDHHGVHRRALDHAVRRRRWASRPTRCGFRRSSRC